MDLADAQLQYRIHFVDLLGGQVTSVFENRRAHPRGDTPDVYAEYEGTGALFIALGEVIVRASDGLRLDLTEEMRLLVADLVMRVVSLRRLKAVPGCADVTAEAWAFTALTIPSARQLERLPVVDARGAEQKAGRSRDQLEQELIDFLEELNDSLKD